MVNVPAAVAAQFKSNVAEATSGGFMTKVVFHQAYDFENVDLAEFFGGSINLATATTSQFTISEGKFAAEVSGENFNPFTMTGTVHEVDVLYKNRPLFTASNMNVSLGDVVD